MSKPLLSLTCLLLCSANALLAQTAFDAIANVQNVAANRKTSDSLNMFINPIRVNQAGYLESDKEKLIYVVGDQTDFEVVKASDSSKVGQGTLVSTDSTTSSSITIKAYSNAVASVVAYTMFANGPSGILRKGILPSTLPTNEPLRVRVGKTYSADFVINNNVYTLLRNAVIPSFGLLRSKHDLDTIQGGWYDCGDYLKESISQSYALALLGLFATAYPQKDQDQYDATQSDPLKPDGISDVKAEAIYGAQYVLNAYEYAKGNIDEMKLSVGDFAKEHAGWNLPEIQQAEDVAHGGAPRILNRDLWSTTAGRFAAGLAFASKLTESSDPTFSSKCLNVAKKLYDFGKQEQSTGNSMAWGGETPYSDDMAFAALALFYATKTPLYLQDLAYDQTIGAQSQQGASFPKTAFSGGWLAHSDILFNHLAGNTGWSSTHSFVLLGMYKLLLQDTATANSFGIKADRAILLERIANNLSISMGYLNQGTSSIQLPAVDAGWATPGVRYHPIWFNLSVQSTWAWNWHQIGNIIDVLAYAEVTESMGPAWKSSEVRQLALRQMDYMLGLNPWDISMINGVGDKNWNHPHDRQCNSEGILTCHWKCNRSGLPR